eukprot:329563-Pleurochrysis_carterae.AAC.2
MLLSLSHVTAMLHEARPQSHTRLPQAHRARRPYVCPCIPSLAQSSLFVLARGDLFIAVLLVVSALLLSRERCPAFTSSVSLHSLARRLPTSSSLLSLSRSLSFLYAAFASFCFGLCLAGEALGALLEMRSVGCSERTTRMLWHAPCSALQALAAVQDLCALALRLLEELQPELVADSRARATAPLPAATVAAACAALCSPLRSLLQGCADCR